MLRTFEIERKDWENFSRIVGFGNASATLRNFIMSYGEKTDINERKLRKEFEIVDNEHNKVKARWQKLKSKIEEIDEKRKQEELEKIKKEETFKKKMQDIEYETKKKDMWRL